MIIFLFLVKLKKNYQVESDNNKQTERKLFKIKGLNFKKRPDTNELNKSDKGGKQGNKINDLRCVTR